MNWQPYLAQIRTQHKAGRLLLTPSYRLGEMDSHALDCPFPFAHAGAYWMTLIFLPPTPACSAWGMPG